MEPKYYLDGQESDQGYPVEENGCPVCGNQVSHGGTHVKLKEMTTKWTCMDCGSEGEEVFEIQFVAQRVNIELSKENRDG